MRVTGKKIAIGALSLVAVAALAIGAWAYSHAAYVAFCAPRNDLSADERDPFEKASLRLAESIVRGNLNEVYAQGTAEVKGRMQPAQFAAMRQAYNQPMTGLTALRVTHSYRLRSVSGAEDVRMPLCPAVSSGVISRPEDQVFVAMKSGGEQAHVIVEGDNNKSTWNFAFWLMPEEGEWRMQGLYFGPATMSGKSGSDFWAQAREQRDVGHIFNAAMLYSAASSLAFRGANLQLGIWREMQGELKNLHLPAELQGVPPYQWQFGSDSYRVLRVQPFFAGGETDLTVRIQVPSLSNNAKANDDLNHALIRHLTDAYPEIFDSFNAIVIEAVEAGGRSYRTVEYGHKAPAEASAR